MSELNVTLNPSVDPRDAKALREQNFEILALLRLRPRTSMELAHIALKYTSRISELRQAGYVIRATRSEGRICTYTLVSEPNNERRDVATATAQDDALREDRAAPGDGTGRNDEVGERGGDATSGCDPRNALPGGGGGGRGEEGGALGADRRRAQEVLTAYRSFLVKRSQLDGDYGFAPLSLPDFLFDFQRALVDWSLRKGRGAIFADCGLGKTPMQLVWADNVVRKTNGAVLILTPLAVASQTLREAERFGIECQRGDADSRGPGIFVTNYQRLHHLDPSHFVGVVCDESSILKSFDGVTRAAVTEFMRKLPYRLLCTATAAPNDYTELGTSSEALGYLGHMDMLNRFFVNDRNNSHTGRAWATMGGGQAQWRFRGHAEQPFWRWVCSWARSLRRPSDLGFDDSRFALPPLNELEVVVKARMMRPGELLPRPAIGLAEQREERRRTLTERCEQAASLVDTEDPAVVWCHLNDEANLVEKLVDGAVQVSGDDSDDAKEEKFNAFSSGAVRVLVTKPAIGAWGLNWQHCAHMTCFASHSFEQYYQSVRRFWRFGQTRPVTVHHVVSDGESGVLKNLQRKSEQADRLYTELVGHMRDELAIARTGLDFAKAEEIPSWL